MSEKIYIKNKHILKIKEKYFLIINDHKFWSIYDYRGLKDYSIIKRHYLTMPEFIYFDHSYSFFMESFLNRKNIIKRKYKSFLS